MVPILVIAYFIYDHGSVFADTFGVEKGAIGRDTYYLKLNDNRFKTRFVLSTKEKNAKDRAFELVKYNLIGAKERLELSGFEQICSLEDHYLIDGTDYLFFLGDVGAHSRNLEAVKVTSNGMAGAVFQKDGTTTGSIVSDLPKFDFQQDQNGLDILVYNRDYDHDPLKNYLVDKYVLKNGLFEFSGESKALANEENQPDSRAGGIK